MNTPNRILLTINLGEGKPLPSNIVALLREDLLGSGIHVNVASVTSYTDGVIEVVAEAFSVIGADGEGLQKATQAHLDEIYGTVEVEDEEVDDDLDEDEEEDEEEDETVTNPPADVTPPASETPVEVTPAPVATETTPTPTEPVAEAPAPVDPVPPGEAIPSAA